MTTIAEQDLLLQVGRYLETGARTDCAGVLLYDEDVLIKRPHDVLVESTRTVDALQALVDGCRDVVVELKERGDHYAFEALASVVGFPPGA